MGMSLPTHLAHKKTWLTRHPIKEVWLASQVFIFANCNHPPFNLKKFANVLLSTGPVFSDNELLKNRILCIVCLKFWFSIYFWPKTYKNKYKHLNKLINDIKKPKNRTKNPKLWFSIHFWPKTHKKKYRHLDKPINEI